MVLTHEMKSPTQKKSIDMSGVRKKKKEINKKKKAFSRGVTSSQKGSMHISFFAVIEIELSMIL